MKMFLMLLIGHVIADYPLQGEFLARAKNRTNPIPGVPWWQAMFAHALIHAGAVWLITGSLFLGFAEFVMHHWIDDSKCRGKLSFNQDQALHVLCKFMWVVAAMVLL
nr:hypothetical protein HUO10_003302 [Paraburkholderia busanensis]